MVMDVFTYAGVLFIGALIYALSSLILGSILETVLYDRTKEGSEYYYLWIAGGVPFVVLLFNFFF